MLNEDNFKSITQLRKTTLQIIQAIQEQKNPIYIISRSKLQAVLLHIDTYGELLTLKRENKALKEQLAKLIKG